MSPIHDSTDGLMLATLELQQRVFADTWRELLASRHSAASEDNEDATRTAIIGCIMDLTATGVREPGRLKRHALHAAKLTRPRALVVPRFPD